jgi:hypothetical protein
MKQGVSGLARRLVFVLALAALGGCAGLQGERVMEPAFGGDYLSGMDTDVVSINWEMPAA